MKRVSMEVSFMDAVLLPSFEPAVARPKSAELYWYACISWNLDAGACLCRPATVDAGANERSRKVWQTQHTPTKSRNVGLTNRSMSPPAISLAIKQLLHGSNSFSVESGSITHKFTLQLLVLNARCSI